jgi:hypothetical protein
VKPTAIGVYLVIFPSAIGQWWLISANKRGDWQAASQHATRAEAALARIAMRRWHKKLAAERESRKRQEPKHD